MNNNEWISNSGDIESVMAGIDDDDIYETTSVEGANIRLEIWVGTDDEAEGHVQTLTIEQVKQLEPVIGKMAVDSLLENIRCYGID